MLSNSTPTEIIVYRSPQEAAFYQSGLMFPLIAAMVVAVVVGFLTGYLLDRFGYSRAKWTPAVVTVASFAAGIFTIWKLWI